MRDYVDKNDLIQSEVKHSSEIEDSYLVYLFWIKVIFGVIGGVGYYFLQRILFDIGSFDINYLFRGLLLFGVFSMYYSFIQSSIMSLLYIFKKKMNIPEEVQAWRVSFRFSITFLVVFVISASITFYIGY
ncbi:MAG: hypothetical protein ACFE9Z_01010 [Promethearchaeota archaeon]